MRTLTEPVGLPALTGSDLLRQVARRLTGAIPADRFPARAKLAEAAVTSELGISRAPVREASRLLESRGLLEASPRRGFFVRRLSPEQVDDLCDLRLCVRRRTLARTHEPILAAIDAGRPERIVAHVDHHIGVAWREGGALVRGFPPTGAQP